MAATLLNMDVVEGLRSLPDQSVHVVVTSPPYHGLRAYLGVPPKKWADGTESVFGLESSVELYIAHLVEIFRELKRVLHPSGTFWLNIGDCYDHAGPQPSTGIHARNGVPLPETFKRAKSGRSKKNLAMVPARAALGLQNDGWVLRQDIIWAKGLSFCPSYSGSVMPESIVDRSIWAHEHLYQFSLSHWSGKPVKPLSERDAVWLAAMIDGEGCIAITRAPAENHPTRVHDGFTPWVVITNTSEKIIAEVARICGKQPVQRGGANRPAFHVRLAANEAAELLRAVKPYLIQKGPQAELALALQGSRIHRGGKSYSGFTQENNDYQRKLWESCKGLNQAKDIDLSWVEFEKEGRFIDSPYFYDIDGCREPYAESTRKEAATSYEGQATKDYAAAGAQDPSEVKRRVLASVARGVQRQDQGLVEGSASSRRSTGFNARYEQAGVGRNLRNVWVIPKEPLKEAHFAAFPTKLVEPVIKLGSSEHGCCPACLNPYVRNTIREKVPDAIQAQFNAARAATVADTGRVDGYTARKPNYRRKVLGIGWAPSCTCDAGNPIPCTVLDPFSGSGRAGVVAKRLGRDFIGIDASAEYCAIARRVIDAS